MFKTIPLPALQNRTELDRVLMGQNARLATNREIPTDRFHELVFSQHGIIVLFCPKVTRLDEKGILKKDDNGGPIFFDEAPFVGHFRHGILSPVSFDSGRFESDAPALIAAD
jgi:hypothetical protein